MCVMFGLEHVELLLTPHHDDMRGVISAFMWAGSLFELSVSSPFFSHLSTKMGRPACVRIGGAGMCGWMMVRQVMWKVGSRGTIGYVEAGTNVVVVAWQGFQSLACDACFLLCGHELRRHRAPCLWDGKEY